VNTHVRHNKVDVPYKIAPRRDGDIAECYANTEYAFSKLGFKAEYELAQMVESAYNFVKKQNKL